MYSGHIDKKLILSTYLMQICKYHVPIFYKVFTNKYEYWMSSAIVCLISFMSPGDLRITTPQTFFQTRFKLRTMLLPRTFIFKLVILKCLKPQRGLKLDSGFPKSKSVTKMKGIQTEIFLHIYPESFDLIVHKGEQFGHLSKKFINPGLNY